jgi:acyl-CoA reductase-like NAD-dependent aldehyde dehydrogenase
MTGKPLIQAKREIDTMIDRAENLYKLAADVMKDDNISIDSTNVLKIKKDPIGISFLISPWNYPLITVVGSLVPSILFGNPVVLKHSPRTPLVGNYFEEAFKSVGALNVVQHLFLRNEDVSKIYTYDEINFVGFTGSVETGRKVLKDIAMANRFIHTNFELGGKDAAYVCEDADLDFAVDNVVDGAMYNSGQSCCAIERVYVHSSIYDEFCQKASDLITKQYKLGNPLSSETNFGPMALPDAPILLKEQVEEAVSSGAEIVCGGNIVNDSTGNGRFFEPTLLKECNNDMQIVAKESFGPVLPVIKVENDDEAIDLINSSEYGLTSALYTKDYNKANLLANRVFTFNID